MKKKKGAVTRSTARKSVPKRAAARKKPALHAAKLASRSVRARDARAAPRGAARRELYPALEPFRHGFLRVSHVQEIYTVS
jgi:hypothetical protein